MPAILGIMNLWKYNFLLVVLEIQNPFVHKATELSEVTNSSIFWLRFIIKAWKYFNSICRKNTTEDIEKENIYLV